LPLATSPNKKIKEFFLLPQLFFQLQPSSQAGFTAGKLSLLWRYKFKTQMTNFLIFSG